MQTTPRPTVASRALWVLAIAAVAAALAAPATALAAPPTATTRAAQDVTATAATVRGLVNPQDRPTSWHFEYATDADYSPGSYTDATESRQLAFGVFGVQVPTVLLDSGVSYRLTGLDPSTTYHFRVVATNSDGTANGSDLTFATPAS